MLDLSNKKQDPGKDSPGQDGKNLLATCGTALLGLVSCGAYVTAARMSGAVEYRGVETTKELEANFWSAVESGVTILRVDALLSHAPVEDLAREGKGHAAFTELKMLINELEKRCGKKHLEMPLLPGDEMSKERRLYGGCLNLVNAMSDGDLKQTELTKAGVLQALSLFKE